MTLDFFCPYWGQTHVPLSEFLARIRDAGYVGIETAVPDAANQADAVAGLLAHTGLELIAQLVMSQARDFDQYRAEYLLELEALAALKPRLINAHTGRDHFSFEQNVQLLQEAQALADRVGVNLCHETHRGRFSFNPWQIERYLAAVPGMRLTADLSHWCVVTESLLEGDVELVARIAHRCGHIHARVGHANSPQVSDPQHPDWAPELALHTKWWRQIISAQNQSGIAVTPEFGPPTYMPVDPRTNEPVADQWQLNLYIKQHLQSQSWA